MQYPLEERIGTPELLVGRAAEFKKFNKWINNMPKKLSKSWAILGRRKSGKTAFVQRLFNQLWSANGPVIPFYISIPEAPIWYLTLAVDYYETFASQYIAFMERDPQLVSKPLTLTQIKTYGQTHGNTVLVEDVDYITMYREQQLYDLVWKRAYTAPHRMAAVYDQRILVIIDEFQYLAMHVYRDAACAGQPVKAMPGSFHSVSESKVAPMLATGSYVGWMLEIMGKYLEAGRLSAIEFSPYLAEAEGLRAVYQYAAAYQEPLTNATAVQINALCMADPFFISCVIQSNYPQRDLTHTVGVIEAVNYEIANRQAQLAGTWSEYINQTVDRINDKYGKQLLLYLSKHNERYWTPRQLKAALQLAQDEQTIHRKLLAMVKGDLIEWGSSDIRFRGLRDGTLNLILQHRFEEEIAEYQNPPDLRPAFQAQIVELQHENKVLQGKLNNVVGHMAEYMLANTLRSRHQFKVGAFFEFAPAHAAHSQTQLHLIQVHTRVHVQRADGKDMELDIVAQAREDRVLLVEVRKRQVKATRTDVADFQAKVQVYQAQHPAQQVHAGFLSVGGFTGPAQHLCAQTGIGWTTTLPYF